MTKEQLASHSRSNLSKQQRLCLDNYIGVETGGDYGGLSPLMHLNGALSSLKWAKRYESSFLSSLVRKQLMQSLAMFMNNDTQPTSTRFWRFH